MTDSFMSQHEKSLRFQAAWRANSNSKAPTHTPPPPKEYGLPEDRPSMDDATSSPDRVQHMRTARGIAFAVTGIAFLLTAV